jgi:hypothetical protein
MSNFQIVSASKHGQTRVVTAQDSSYGDSLMYVPTFPLEFRDIQSCYPIFFLKEVETGQFFAAALCGFEPEENLFLNNGNWDASYLPMMIRRQPFLIARQTVDPKSADETLPVISIDMDHTRVSDKEGERLFSEEGKPSDFLQEAIQLLKKIHRAHQHNENFTKTLLQYDLLESLTLDITFNNGSKKSLTDFYTINETKLYELEGQALAHLNKEGFLQPIFMAIASFSRLRALIDRKNTP